MAVAHKLTMAYNERQKSKHTPLQYFEFFFYNPYFSSPLPDVNKRSTIK